MMNTDRDSKIGYLTDFVCKLMQIRRSDVFEAVSVGRHSSEDYDFLSKIEFARLGAPVKIPHRAKSRQDIIHVALVEAELFADLGNAQRLFFRCMQSRNILA